MNRRVWDSCVSAAELGAAAECAVVARGVPEHPAPALHAAAPAAACPVSCFPAERRRTLIIDRKSVAVGSSIADAEMSGARPIVCQRRTAALR